MYPSIESSASEIINATLNITNATVVPDTDDVVMKNGGKLIDAVYLYADLADSTALAHKLKPEAAAAIIRAYINSASRILGNYGGEIRSFDGDRVMAIFIGANKEWNAVRAAFAINWAVIEVLKPLIKDHWTDVDGLYQIDHGVGIDTGEALIVRGGVRNHNDLISVGRAPNVAAKLSSVRGYYSLLITSAVKDALSDDLLEFNSSSIWRSTNHVVLGGSYYSVHGSNGYWGL